MPPDSLLTSPVQVLARTAWGEARGEGREGMQAVMNVIARRAATPCWWGRDIVTVCLKPWQFSCWNKNDPNNIKILTVTDNDKQFRDSLELSGQLTAGFLPDLTNRSDHYFNIHSAPPAWAAGNTPECILGNHAFYRLGPYGQEKNNA